METSRRKLLKYVITSSGLYLLSSTSGASTENQIQISRESSSYPITTGGEISPRCSFCNASEAEVHRIIAGPNIFICDKCVRVCQEIIGHDSLARKEQCQEFHPVRRFLVLRSMWFKPKPGKTDQLTSLLAEIARNPLSETSPFRVKWTNENEQSIRLFFLIGIPDEEFELLVQHQIAFDNGFAFNGNAPQVKDFGDKIVELTQSYKSESRVGVVECETRVSDSSK